MAVTFSNRGQQLLDQQVKEAGTLRAVASKVPEIHENQLGNYHRGRVPLGPARQVMEDKLGIGWRTWDQPAEEARGAA